jgi:hypothetical protein
MFVDAMSQIKDYAPDTYRTFMTPTAPHDTYRTFTNSRRCAMILSSRSSVLVPEHGTLICPR